VSGTVTAVNGTLGEGALWTAYGEGWITIEVN
jgi:hypothetical protein